MNKREYDILETKENILADNDKVAAEVRNLLISRRVFMVNLMASPGAGKTTTLVRTINSLKNKYRIGVMEADVDSDVDAATIQKTGAKVIQLHTGGSCHMDADMTRRGIVCPAEFDVGSAKRVAILSVPEGDDKPLKYPLMFTVSDLLLIGKIDVKPAFDFDESNCRKYVNALNPKIKVISVSAKTGEGFDEWINWLELEIESFRAGAQR